MTWPSAYLLTYLLTSDSGIGHINEGVLRRARLVLRWVTFHGFHLGT